MTPKIIIFTDLDGTLLDRDTFKFDKISGYLKDLILEDIYIIPNSSKTRQEIEVFNKELDENLVNLKISLIANFTLLFQNSSELFSFKILTCKFPSPA